MAASVTYSMTTTLAETIANNWTSGDQILPDVTGLSNGGYVVAYNATNNNGFILLNFFDANGNITVGHQLAYDGATAPSGPPSITQLSNGKVLVVLGRRRSA